ncbi:amidase [Halobacillus shinanisalinarum]|uniref:Amidase n=1 Tax=Halobacillus shinanisalinarum TaxID=2932258 RepID=A0ABY4GWG8_9BACI|nr:amidase [Halobacillus shinanisalinarum]UOQ92309.1 amidase [Halobacillus shinanisalinarum]
MDHYKNFSTARHLAKAIQKRELSVREVVEAHLAQIERVNPEVNAIISLDEDHALKEANKADEILATGKKAGPLHGLPIAIKDTHNAKGFPMTSGSLALRDNISTEDDLIVERLRNAGAIVIGKTNVPEFGAGAHTFNEVFGVTRNPYNLNRTAGGSSGGAAAAVASGMLPLADGSDMGGSCRFPAAFNNVVGMRTSPGRVPMYPKAALYSPLVTQGPIARNVEDASFMLSVLAGQDNRSPISIAESGEQFLNPFDKNLNGLRIAWSADFGGILPVDPAVSSNMEEQMKIFTDLGCHVEEACPDLVEADEVFHVFRAWEIEMSNHELFDRFEEVMKPSFKWNFNKGRKLRGIDIGRAERLRNQLYHRMRVFFDQYDALILPVSQVPPFDVNLEYPEQINGVPMETYIDWMRSSYYISALGNPSLSVPSGFTSDRLPLGLQIVGPHQADYEVLRIGHAFEQATHYGEKRPKIAQSKDGHIPGR